MFLPVFVGSVEDGLGARGMGSGFKQLDKCELRCSQRQGGETAQQMTVKRDDRQSEHSFESGKKSTWVHSVKALMLVKRGGFK